MVLLQQVYREIGVGRHSRISISFDTALYFSISECSILVYCVPATYHSHIHSPPERHVRHHHDHTNHRQTIPFQRFVDIYFPGTFIQGHCFRYNFHCVTYVTDFVFIVFGLGIERFWNGSNYQWRYEELYLNR